MVSQNCNYSCEDLLSLGSEGSGQRTRGLDDSSSSSRDGPDTDNFREIRPSNVIDPSADPCLNNSNGLPHVNYISPSTQTYARGTSDPLKQNFDHCSGVKSNDGSRPSSLGRSLGWGWFVKGE
mmetsp:Transcript_13331/g.22308  ORF Transcript_13331/g.22308 Transcript_13331/m.22308 type:complete len:123 (+) Transcript_13331:465-833(+)